MALVLLGAALGGCGQSGGGSDGVSGTAAAQMSQSVSGLLPNTTYYWKVIASDGTYSMESETRSFTTE